MAGGELDVLFTEYNLSQRDFTLGAVMVVGGVDLDLGAVRPLLRAGGGAAGGDGRGGAAWFWEAGVDVPLAANAALRIATRRAELRRAGHQELSLLLVATPGGGPRISRWSVGWAWGARGRERWSATTSSCRGRRSGAWRRSARSGSTAIASASTSARRRTSRSSTPTSATCPATSAASG